MAENPSKSNPRASHDVSTHFRARALEHPSGRTESQSAIEQDHSSVIEILKRDDLDHLSSDERRILQRQLAMPSVKVSYFMLYRYATRIDILILIVSIL